MTSNPANPAEIFAGAAFEQACLLVDAMLQILN